MLNYENSLKLTINYSQGLINKGYSYDYLIEPCLNLADTYYSQRRYSEALELYRYINSILTDSDYDLKSELGVKINNIDTIIQNNYADKGEYEKNTYQSYDGTFLIRLQDLIYSLDNIVHTLRR